MKTAEQFLDGPNACPICHKDDSLDYDNLTVHDGGVDQRGYCGNCGGRWYECYDLVGYEFNDIHGDPVFVGKEAVI